VPEPTRGTCPRVLIVGGGITGLATAWYLQTGQGADRLDISLIESSGRVGGKIRTEELGGVPVEAGPDTFLARVPWAVDLARQLGLGDDLVAPATGTAYICHRGRLLPFPSDTVLGVPVTTRSLLGAPQLSAAGKARAALDVVLPRRRAPLGPDTPLRGPLGPDTPLRGPLGPDPSVADVIGSRLGREVLDRLVEPLVGGIHAGRADSLSLRSVAPQLATAATHHRSLIRGLRAQRPAMAATSPVFLSVAGGLERLVDRLAASLDVVDIRLDTAATGLTAEAGRWRLACEPGPDVTADAVVLAIPAFAAAPVVVTASPGAADDLERIRYASVVTATLAYRPGHLTSIPAGSGFLVPRSESRLMTACTFSTAKWRHPGPGDTVLLRASAGRHGDDRACRLDDEALVDRLHDELRDLVGATGDPVAFRVDRWENGFPQYEPGHDARVDRIEAALSRLDGVFVAGASFRGVGIAACVQQAGTVSARVRDHLSQHRPAAGET